MIWTLIGTDLLFLNKKKKGKKKIVDESRYSMYVSWFLFRCLTVCFFGVTVNGLSNKKFLEKSYCRVIGDL